MTMRIPDFSKRFYCNSCEKETTHWPISNGLIESKTQADPERYQTFEVMQCRDCGQTTYCINHWIHPGPMMGDSYIERTEYFPPLAFRKKPAWFSDLDDKYKLILDQVYTALDNSLFTLASTGIRTALDRLIVEKVSDVGGFDAKIGSLEEKSIINEGERELLVAVINAGSASAHRGFKPDEESIIHMMEITEHIFYQLCIESDKKKALLEKAEKLKKITPKRRKA